MPSASNTSNSSNLISTSTNFIVQQNVGSRLTVELVSPRESIEDGIKAGHVIRYDVLQGKYVKADATAPEKSEVFGVVESVSEDGSTYLVVTYGPIRMNSEKLKNNAGSGTNFGGNDVYFLSTDPGFLQSINPSSSGQIIKPVYQVAPVGDFTGVVVNYVGYTVTWG